MTVQLVGRARPDPVRLSTLQVQLLASALMAGHAPDRDLLAPGAYVPSHVCASWSEALFAVLPDLVVAHVWDDRRAQLRPLGVVRAPVSLQRGGHRKRHTPDPWTALPPLAERTALMDDPLGPLLLHLAGWLATCGGFQLAPG
ncbi:MAG: hypothetical protein JWN17_2375 [Frankiales bacterium]|nr:hypothetical protein [Frankiales bacterium]